MRKVPCMHVGMLLCWLPLLALAGSPALAQGTATPAARVFSVSTTQSVQFDGSLPQLQERLHLAPAQQAAWSRFADSVQAYSQVFFSERPASDFPQETAPRQLERMNARMQARQRSLQAIEDSGRALYAVLDAQQRATADMHLLASVPVFGFQPPSH